MHLDRSLLMVATVPQTLQGFLLPIASHMRGQGWRVDGAAHSISSSEGCAQGFDNVFDVDWSRNPADPSNLSSALRSIRELVEREGYSVVHVHTPVAAFVTRLALKNLRAQGRVRVIYTAHGFHFHERNPAAKNALFLTAEKIAGRWTDRLVLINEYDVEQAIEHNIVPKSHVVYMHGIGIDTHLFDPSAVSPDQVERLRAEIGVRDDESLYLVPAEFIARKRQNLVVDALAFTERDDLHVAFVGDGPTQLEVIHKAIDAGVGQRTHFLGWRDDIPALMRSSQATVLYSNQEGLSRAVMESLAMECPVIGSDIRGIRELVADGCGIAVDPDRPDELAAALMGVGADPEWAREMGRAGRAKMADVYEEKHIVEQHLALYEDVLAHA